MGRRILVEGANRTALAAGLNAVRSDLGLGLAQDIDRAYRKSIQYAQAHPKEPAVAYALQYGAVAWIRPSANASLACT